MNILSLDNVVKRYYNHTAVDHVSFDVEKGKIFGLLGPNGAGKTSLIRIITTITGADDGQILLDGERLNADHPSKIGYMPEERGLYKKMKVGDQLMYLARLKGMSKSDARDAIKFWFDRFQIKDWWNKKIEELSKGMQQKVQFIATVVHGPKLLILDEPFSGLDPINTNLIKDELYRLNQEGTSIIFSTHRMEQVEEICEDIVLINQGKKILSGNVTDIKNQNKEGLYRVAFDGTLNSNVLNGSFDIISEKGDEIILKIREGHDSNELLQIIINAGVQLTMYQEILPTLNEIFIKKVEGITLANQL